MIRELRREVLQLRKKRTLLLVALLLPVPLAVVWLVRALERVRHVHDTQLVLVPSVVTYERVVNVPAQRAACPPERGDAPRVQPAQPPEVVERVRPSETNAGWIAAWNANSVFVSMDAGASWKRMLDGPGRVRDVGFDCHGNAIAVRGKRVGIARDRSEVWHPLPMLDLRDRTQEKDDWQHEAEAVVIGGGPDIAIIGHAPFDDDPTWQARLVVSRDGGVTFLQRDLTEYWESTDIAGRQGADGSIVAMLPQSDCGGDAPWMFRFDGETVSESHASTSAELEIFGDLIVANDGWQRIGSDDTFPIEGLDKEPAVLAGPHPILVADNTLYRFANGKATPLPWKIAADTMSLTVDRAGRVWSIACGSKLHIATRAEPPRCDNE